MLLYYHSWMFYNHFIANLHHFLGLAYWHSFQCQLLFFACFLLHKISISNGVQTQRNFLEIFFGPEDTQWAKEVPDGAPRGAQPTWAHLGAQARPGALCPPRPPPAPPSLLYKYPENPKTLGESTKHNFSCRKIQKQQIQSRHHHGGVPHPHWCLSDDAWVVHCRPTGP